MENSVDAKVESTAEQELALNERSAHTPGPWRVGFHDGSGRGEDRDGCWILQELPEHELMADEGTVVRGGQMAGLECGVLSGADANLIAAAPELLEACQVALGTFRRQLISEDRTGRPFCGDDEHESISVLTAAIAKAKGGPA